MGAGALFLQDSSNSYLYDVVTKEQYSFSDIDSQYNSAALTVSPYSFSIADGILDWANSSINTNSVYKITGFGNGSDYWLMTDLAGPTESVCAPTAATNLMWYWVIYALSDFLIMILSWLVKQSLRAFLFQEVQP